MLAAVGLLFLNQFTINLINMKKSLAITCLLLFTVSLFNSCEKDCDQAFTPLLIPAVQKVREAASRNWQQDSKFLEKIEIGFSEPLETDFLNFETDSNVVITCRVKFKNNPKEVLLPYTTVINAAGDKQSYFYTAEKDKVALFCYNPGTSDAIPVESLSLNFAKIK